MRKRYALLLALMCGAAWGVPVPQAELSLDIESGARQLAGKTSLNYDSAWVGGGPSFKITANGGAVAQVNGVGAVPWSSRRPGEYVLTAQPYVGGALAGDPLTATFIVQGHDLVRAQVEVLGGVVLYDGTARTPKLNILLDGQLLVEGVDYTLSYENNVGPGQGKAIVTGLGAYQDEIEVPFAILPAGVCTLDIESGTREADGTETLNLDCSWLGASKLAVTANGIAVGESTGVEALEWTPAAAGDYLLEVTHYLGSEAQLPEYTARFHVQNVGVPLEVAFETSDILFDGTASKPAIRVSYQGKTLVEGVDYTATYLDNTAPGMARVIVTGIGEYAGSTEKTFRIRPAGTCFLDIADGVRKVDAGATQTLAYDYKWNGGESSTVRILADEVAVADGVKVGNCTWTPGSVGMHTLKYVTYTGSALGETLEAQFYVPGQLADAEITVVDENEILYDGGQKRPSVVVRTADGVLVEGLDYTLEYTNNIQPGAATLTVVGAHGERIAKTFTIRPAGICGLDIESGVREAKDREELTYDTWWQGVGNANFKISVDGVEMGAGSGRGSVVWLPKSVGNHEVVCRTYINGLLNEEELTATFHVTGRDLVGASITINEDAILYDGTERKPTVTIFYQGKTLTQGIDYALTYAQNVNPGMGVMTVTGLGDYHDVVEVPFEIRPAGICNLDIESGYRLAKPSEKLNYDYQWDGGAQNVTRMQMRVNDEILAEMSGIGTQAWNPGEVGGQYIVKYRTYVSNYLQEDKIETAYFGIPGGDLNNWDLEITLEHSVYVYDGQPKTPKVTVATVLGPLIEGQDFTVQYLNNIEIGTATVRIAGAGIYFGTVDRTFRIVAPMGVALPVARQRYPWNGKVDIALSIAGDAEQTYTAAFSVLDGIGKTNLPVKTFYSADGVVTNTTQTVNGGVTRFVWDADNDLPNWFVCSNAIVHVEVENLGALPQGETVKDASASATMSLDIQFYEVYLVDKTSYGITYGFENGKSWTKDTGTRKNEAYSYKSYGIGNSASTYLTAKVKGAGTFSFWWKVSSESGYDWLRYYVNGTEKAKISGSQDWAQISIPITSTGETEIKWTYSKDGSSYSGSDCGWVEPTWTPTAVFETNYPSSWPRFLTREEWMPTRAIRTRQPISYSAAWEEGATADATVEMSIDDSLWVKRTGEGVETWRPAALGTNVLSHVTKNGEVQVGKTLKARFIVEAIDGQRFPEGSITVTGYAGKYDGASHGITVTAPDGATVRYAESAAGPFGDNPAYLDAGARQVWCEVTKDGYLPATNSAWVTISPREVTLTSGSGSKKYDGIALTNWTHVVSGDDFIGDDGVTCSYSGTQTAVGSSKNTFDYALKNGTKASNYTITKVEGLLEVTKGTIGPGGEEPGGGEVPPGGLSKFDATAMYDGDGHTIDTNKLFAAFAGVMVGEFEIKFGRAGSMNPPSGDFIEVALPVWTNVVATSLWYKVTSPNYEDFVHEAKVTITNRPIALASVAAIADQTYTGSAIKPVPTVTDQRTLIGATSPTDIITTDDYAVSYADNIDVGTAKVILTGANNYAGVVTNTFQIVPAIIPPGPGGAITAIGYTNAYDGAAHGVTVAATGLVTTPTVQYRRSSTAEWQSASPTYADVCDTQVWWKVSAPNYSDATGTIGVKITPRSVTLTSGTKTDFAYDGTPHEFSVMIISENPFAAGEGITTSNWASVTTVAEGQVDNTFDYAPIAGTKLENYNISVVTGRIAVVKGTIPGGGDEPGGGEVPPGGVSKFDATAMYDGEVHTLKTNELVQAFRGVIVGEFAVEYARGDVGRGATDAPGAGAWSPVVPVFTNACEEIVWYKVTNPNYEDYVHAAKVMVTNRPVTVTSASGSWEYDTLVHGTNAVEVAISGKDGAAGVRALPSGVVGLIGDDSLEVGGFPTITDVGSKPNAFDWMFGAGTLATNYCVSCVTGTIAVTPRVLGGDPSKWDIRLGENLQYNGFEQTITITQVAFIKPDGNLEMIPYTVAGNKGTDSGNYKAEITGTGNYAGTVTNTWAILPRNVTLTSVTTNWVYDATEHIADEIQISGEGFVSGEGVTCKGFPRARHVAEAADPVENAFVYDWNEGTKAKNYSVTTAFGTVAMAKRCVSLTSPTWSKCYDGKSLTFAGKDIVAALTGDGGGRGATALPEGETFTYGDFASITEAGHVNATFTVADGTALKADYSITPVYGMLTVKANASEITVTARSKSWTYDGLSHTLHEYDADNLSVLTSGDELEVIFEESSAVMTPVDGPNADGVVENKIKSVRVIRGGTKDVSDNYTLGKVSGALTVTKRPVTLTSKRASRAYDGTELTAHEVEVGGDKFVDGEGATYSYTGAQKDVGTSDNTFSYSLNDNTKAAYYTITKVVGKLTVTQVDISSGEEGDWVVVLDPSPTYNGQPQVQTLASVTFKGLTVDYSLSDYQQTDAGNYTLKVTGKGNFTGERLVPWTLAPKALTLIAGSGSKIYDGTDLSVGTVTESGFVAGEGATYVCAGAQRDVGSSDNEISTINWNDGTKSTNYAVSKNKGTLTVTERPVIVKSKDITKPWDGTPLKLTADDITVTYNGGAAGVRALPEGESFVYGGFAERTEAGQTSGTFSVAAGPNTKLTNYTVTPEYGKITITKSATEIGVTANSESWIYDGETHSNRTYTATNIGTLLDTDKLQVAFDESCIVTTPQDGVGGDGKVENRIASVKVIRNGTDDVTGNYTIGIYPGLISVTKRPVSVAVKGKTKSVTYDGEEHTVKGYDISTEDTLYKLTDTAFNGTDEVKGTDAATYDIGLEAGDFTNGNDCFDVAYLVSDGKLTIGKADISSDAGADCEIVLGMNPMYNGTSQTIPVTSVTYFGGRGATALPVTYELKGQTAVNASESILLTVTGTGNFTGEKTTTWKILKRKVTMTSKSATKTYDGTALTEETVTVTGDGFVGQEGANYTVTGQQLKAGSSKNTFTYELKAGTFESNYDISTVFGDLVVNKAKYPGQEPGGAGITWNVSPDAATWMYDGAEHGVTVTGVPTGVTPVYASNVAKDAGTYTASVALLFDAENYEAPVAPAPITWSITQRPITLMAASKDKPYDGFPLEVEPGDITASGSGYATGECFDYYERASITDVGETAATFKYRDSATAKVANYVVTVKGGQTLKVTVGGDQISVTSNSATWAYDGEEHAMPSWTFVNATKLLSGHEFKIKIADSSKIITPKDGIEHNGIVSNAFEYVKIIETATGKDRTKNYNLFVYEGLLKMTNACVGVEMLRGVEKVEKVYDGVATQVVVSATLLQPATVRYWCDADATERVTPEVVFRDEPYAFTHATNAVVWFTVSADYYHTYTGKVEVAIGKRPVTVKTPTRSKTYDGGALTFGAGDVEVALTGGAAGVRALPEGESFVYDDFASIIDAGKIDATCSIAAGAKTSLDDYDITANWGTLTVLASADQVTVTAKNGEWVYTGEPQVLHEYVAENETKLLSGDKLSVAFSEQSVITNPDDGPQHDGIVSNVITSVKVMRGDVDVTKNYSLAWYPGVLKMKNATMTVDDSTFATTHVYDGKGHAANVVAPTLLTSPVTIKYGTTSDAVTSLVSPTFEDAGTYTVFYQISAKYYNVYSGSTTVTITPRSVTLVSAGATRVYNGQPLRKNEVLVKEGSLDFVKDEGFSAICSGSITGVGGMENLFDYELTGGAKSGNYTIKKEYGWLRVTPATLDPSEVLGVDPIAYTWVYDAEAHPFVVTPKMSEPYKMYYSLTANDESTYAEDILTFTQATKTPTPIYFKLMSANFMPLYGTGTVHITKYPVTPPEIASKVYDGTVQTADVQMVVLHGKSAYRILANAGRIEAGEAVVILMLNDSKNYAWTTTDKSFVTLPFLITQAENAWKVQPSISGWSIRDTPSVPVAEAKFGTVSVTYNGTTKSGKKIENALAVTEPGIYTAVFVVPADTCWTGLHSEVVFTVSDGGETPLTVKALGYLGVYDGKPHTISVTVTGGDGNFELTYSESETGPWQKDPPTYVEPCSKTVWYRVTSPNYATMMGKATVTISEARQEESEDVVINPGGGATAFTIPNGWFLQYPKLGGSSAKDWQAIAEQPSGKTDSKGNAMSVWQDYVAGTDPTDLTSRFTATIVFEDGVPVVTWSPALNGEGVKTGVRTYTTYGKVSLGDAEWKVVPDGDEKNYQFFTVTVEMPKSK